MTRDNAVLGAVRIGKYRAVRRKDERKMWEGV